MNSPDESQLGKPSRYDAPYDPSLLYPIPRSPQRTELGIADRLPFFGADMWTAYELSWLNARGKPQVAIAHVTVPCETPNIIESKSFKLYLNSLNNAVFGSATEVKDRLRADLSEAVWRGSASAGSVGVRLVLPEAFDQEPIHELDGVNLDRLDIECTDYTPQPSLLQSAVDEKPVEEVLVSNLLKSNCLVTGQPDWGSIQVRYSGPQIDQGGLLRYIVSYRNHNEFHEPCVERIFMDLWRQCRPIKLAVLARYTRRGGLDINPIRMSHPMALPAGARTARQ